MKLQRWPTAVSLAAGLALVVRLAAAAEPTKPVAEAVDDHRLVRNGVVVQFSARPVDKPARDLMEGDIADVRFAIRDEASGQPVRGVVPGAWMDMAQVIQGRPGTDQKSCKDKVSLYLKGIVGMRPMRRRPKRIRTATTASPATAWWCSSRPGRWTRPPGS